jgi:hypothetical protein
MAGGVTHAPESQIFTECRRASLVKATPMTFVTFMLAPVRQVALDKLLEIKNIVGEIAC